MESERFITETEVAGITGIAVATLQKNRHLGRGIPYVKAGRSVRYSRQAVLDFMNARTVEVTPH